MNTICIFCGSSTGADPEFATAARAVCSSMAELKLNIVFGGGNVGLMATVADV